MPGKKGKQLDNACPKGFTSNYAGNPDNPREKIA
jgi:hypothetical protein